MYIENFKDVCNSKRPQGEKITAGLQGQFIIAKLQQYKALRYQSSETLKLNTDKKTFRELDNKFLEDVKHIGQIDNDLSKLLENIKEQKILSQQECQQLHFQAQLHRQANIINENTKLQYQAIDQYYQCKCGCKRTRGQKIKFTCKLHQFDCLGSGIVLFFIFQKVMIIGLIIASILFGIYVTAKNLSQGSMPAQLDLCKPQDFICSFMNNSSSENTINNHQSIQIILGIVFCAIWTILVRISIFYGKRLNKELDITLNSSSDYAIKLSNLPFGHYDENDLIQHLNSLCLKNEGNQLQIKQSDQQPGKNQMGMKSIQIIYNMDFSRKLINKIQQTCQILLRMVQKNKKGEYFIVFNDFKKYKAYKSSIISTYQLLNDLRKKFLNDNGFRKKLSTDTCIIEFQSEKAKDNILQRFGVQKIGLSQKIKAKIINYFCPKVNNICFHGKIIQIQRAPEPSDIIWLNCQKRVSILRMLFIFFLTMVIILMSFIILLGLQYFKKFFSNSNNKESAQFTTTDDVIAIVTSIALMIVNKILWKVLYVLLDSQYNHTLTNKIVSLMNKALFTTCINTLILPLIVNVYINRQLYGALGLVGFTFNYHLTLLTAGLALQLFNPLDLVLRLLLWIRYSRNKIFRLVRKSFSLKEDEQFKKRILKMYEGQYLDIAETYILILTNIFHAAFYCHLSPSLLFFALLQTFLYYWINKYKVTHLFKIPELTQILVFKTAASQACLVPAVYAAGSFYISYIQHVNNPAYHWNYLHQGVALIIGGISFLNPGGILTILIQRFMGCFESLDKAKLTVDENVTQVCQQSNFQLHKAKSQMMANRRNIKKNSQRYSGKVVRLQNYYKNSNSLKLLAFEQVLKGKDENGHSCELRRYCQNYFKSTDYIIEDAIQQIQQKMIVVISEQPKIEDTSDNSQNQSNSSNQ